MHLDLSGGWWPQLPRRSDLQGAFASLGSVSFSFAVFFGPSLLPAFTGDHHYYGLC